jgi:hypothetical protein
LRLRARKALSNPLMNEQQIPAILAKTKDAAMTGKFELFNTSSHYDGTIRNPSWLGYANG